MIRHLYIASFFLVISLLLNSCASTSNYRRYDKPKEQEPESKNSVIRFAEKDKEQKKVNKYNNPGKDETEALPSEANINPTEFIHKFNSLKKLSRALTPREKVLFEIINYLDTPYKYGGSSKKGIDCSAFTQKVYRKSIGVNLPRTARGQYRVGQIIGKKSKLKFGDLIYFDTQKGVYPGHVGIYIGDSLFAHASSSQGVTISSLSNSYYKSHYVGARRVKPISN